jgi:hypothetical protein
MAPASAVAHWPITEVAARPIEVRSTGHSGLNLLTLSFLRFDPLRTFEAAAVGGLFHDSLAPRGARPSPPAK